MPKVNENTESPVAVAVATEPAAPAAKAPKAKKARKPAAPKATAAKPKASAKGKAAKKAKQPAVKKASNGERGPSIRSRVFALLAKSGGMSGAQIQEKLELSGIPSLLKDEGCCDKPRICRSVIEGTRGVVYQLTAAGKKAVEKGTVDSEKAPRAANQEWPNGR